MMKAPQSPRLKMEELKRRVRWAQEEREEARRSLRL